MNHTYIGITFGPIGRLTESVKSTKAQWASSYFFSYISREIIQPFRTRTFVYPLINEDELWESKKGVGYFPDRYIFKSEEGDTDKLQKQITDVFKDVSEKITSCLFTNNEYQDELHKVYNFIRNFIKVYFFEKCPESLIDKTNVQHAEKGVNIPNEFNRIFDLLEMQDTYTLKEEDNYLLQFFESSNLYESFLVNDAFSEIEYFKSLDKISRAEYSLYKDPVPAKAYHKYIAIISADGDNMTKTINQLVENGQEVIELSKCLFQFVHCIAKTINISDKYGARVIYSGGDDLLIFSPIKYGNNTVFDLIDELNTIFNEQMKFLPTPPTISFGVSITYNKFPMGETLKISKDALYEAKNNFGRNTVVCQLQKHSGQCSKIYLKKENSSYVKALDLLKTYVDNDDALISSLTHWIYSNKQILAIILKEQTNRCDRIKQYFDNSLNESIHHKMSAFIKQVQEYILQFYSESQDTETTIDSTTSLLRIIHFINTKRDE